MAIKVLLLMLFASNLFSCKPRRDYSQYGLSSSQKPLSAFCKIKEGSNAKERAKLLAFYFQEFANGNARAGTLLLALVRGETPETTINELDRKAESSGTDLRIKSQGMDYIDPNVEGKIALQAIKESLPALIDLTSERFSQALQGANPMTPEEAALELSKMVKNAILSETAAISSTEEAYRREIRILWVDATDAIGKNSGLITRDGSAGFTIERIVAMGMGEAMRDRLLEGIENKDADISRIEKAAAEISRVFRGEAAVSRNIRTETMKISDYETRYESKIREVVEAIKTNNREALERLKIVGPNGKVNLERMTDFSAFFKEAERAGISSKERAIPKK